MPTPNNKNRPKTKTGGAAPKSPFQKKHFHIQKARKPALKKPNMDIVVHRSSYSKAARAAVLADAAARQRLIEMGGENTIDVIREFDNDMSDEELAKKTGIKPSEVRVVLNRLHNKGVFSYTRVRDRDSGWYSYIWRLDEERLHDVGCDGGAQGEVVVAASKEGYCCRQCSPDRIVEFDDAVDARFRCSCGGELEFVDARRAIRRQD